MAPIPAAQHGRHQAYAALRSERRRPEETVLYQVVQAHWDEFQERAEEGGGLPSFVTKEVDAYLTCGILEHGFHRLRVRSNRGSRLVRALLAAKTSGVRFISRLKSDGS